MLQFLCLTCHYWTVNGAWDQKKREKEEEDKTNSLHYVSDLGMCLTFHLVCKGRLANKKPAKGILIGN